MEVKQDEMTEEKWQEMKQIAKANVCAECGADLQVHTVPERAVIRIGCLNQDHHGYVERETYTQAMRRGEEIHPAIKAQVEKRMLPGGYSLGLALALVKTRFPSADMDDPSAALFIMDCMRLDLDPLLGEIVPVTFKVTDKATQEVRRVVQPILTEDGWLSLAARACPERWAGPPKTEPITDKDFKKELCGEEEAWVWKATGKTQDGSESVTYGWLKQKEHKKAQAAGTPAGELPGNQARVRAIKRWVRETFPEAKAKMKKMTSEWLARAKDVEGVQEIIEAEYHIVTETPISPKGDEKLGTKEGERGGEEKPAATSLSSQKGEKKGKSRGAAPPAAERTEEKIEGEGFSIDLTWLNEALEALKWSEETAKSWLSKYKIDTSGPLTQVLTRLNREQAEEFVKEIQDKVAQKQMQLFE